jgi:hypothetical protein
VVFDGLNHDGVLALGQRDLHTAGATYRGVWDVTVARNFVGRVDHHDTLAHFL